MDTKTGWNTTPMKSDPSVGQEAVQCTGCGRPTRHLATRQCDSCWEQARRHQEEGTTPMLVATTERQVWSTDDLKDCIARVAMTSLGPTNWHWLFEHRYIEDTLDGKYRKGWLVWVTFDRIDYDTGQPGRGRGRDMILWQGTYKSGVIKTFYALVDQVVQHELRHAFQYNGRELFDPHAPVDFLHSISGQAKADSYNHFKPLPEPNQAAVDSGEIA